MNDTINIIGGIWTNYCNSNTNELTLVCSAINNGVSINITIKNSFSDTSQYSFTVGFINPAVIGADNYTLITYSNNFSKQIATFSIISKTPNILKINFNQNNPYLNENSTYYLSIDGTSPASTMLNITFPSTYNLINSVCLSNCLFLAVQNNTIIYSLNSYKNIYIQIFLTNPYNYS
jgi:hypothetical protein